MQAYTTNTRRKILKIKLLIVNGWERVERVKFFLKLNFFLNNMFNKFDSDN